MGIGNPLLDISANVDQEFLNKYELQLDTAILADPVKHADLYTDIVTTYKDTVQYIAGGATQNSMRVTQWMLSASTNTKYTNHSNAVAFMGCVGNSDEYGKTLESCATSDGVYVHYQKNADNATGTCAALIVDGERSLCANLSAANHFTIDHLKNNEVSKQIIESSQYYYSAGFFLTVSLESYVYVAERMIAENKKVLLNLSAPFIMMFYKDALATAIEHCDYLFGNESEAETYAKENKLNNPEDLKSVAMYLSKLPKKNDKNNRMVIITQGSKSTLVAYQNQIYEFDVEALDKSLLIDTNGAGDAFVGGFLSQLILEKELKDCVNAGHYAAKYMIQRSGTSLGPTSTCTYYKE